MRLAWQTVLLLPALLLPIVVTEAQTCSNSLAGYEASDVCCPLSCGRCGGSGCSKLSGGADDCCTKNVKASGDKCSETKAAPCIIDTDTVDPGDGGDGDDDRTCPGGIPGINAKDIVCCPLECGTCAGKGCSGRPGGASSCCGGGVKANHGLCSVEGKAPCVIDDDPAPTPVTPTPAPVPPVGGGNTCSNGLPGYEASDVCCPLSCGRCGGSGCSKLGDGCCTSKVKDSGDKCSETKSAPCIIDTDTVDPGDGQTCPGGIPGINTKDIVCCPLSCGTCAGKGCSGRPGGKNACCGGGILSTQGYCSDTNQAPCIIGDSPTPTPPTPTPPTPTPPTPTPVGDVESYKITSPTPVMTIPTSCTSSKRPQFRYAASTGKVGKGRLYAESEGCFTMTDIYNWRGTVSSGGVISSKGPIYQLDDSGNIVDPVGAIGEPVTKKWLLAAELYMTNGAIFYCKGSSAGGDCDELRIQSNGPDDWYEVRGHGGSLYFEDTVVTSWDTSAKKPQATYEGGRSFLNCVSEKLTGETCDGRAKNERGECRMDLINSEIGYLGWFDSESYGITWKVRGFCKDLSNHDVFTTTNVYGDIKGCDIHHNYYGHYSYGHQGGVWINNKMRDNHQYGFDPHDDSDYLTIANNKVYRNFNHGIIASKRCNHVKIYDNTVYDGGPDAVGIFLHRSSDEAQVYENTIYNMQDAGIALMESMNADIHDNDISDCRMGIRMSMGSAGNRVYDNTFDKCGDQGFNTYRGTKGLNDPTPGIFNYDRDGHPHDNVFEGNTVSNTKLGVKLKDCDDIVIKGNTFTGTEELQFFDAQNTQWSGNSLPSGVCVDNVTSDDGDSIPASTFKSSNGLPGSC
eukprot:g6520.t1